MPAPTETPALRITAPARLHLGFIDLNGGLGRLFGSIGLAIDRPATRIEVRLAKADTARGPEGPRALQVVSKLRDAFGLSHQFEIVVDEAIPAHAGLGSGTQLALAVATGVLRLEGKGRPADLVGALTGRGQRSAIGIAAFDEGGFIVDGGKGPGSAPPPVLIRAGMPEQWRILLVLDPHAAGVHGDRETTAFATLPPMRAERAAHLSHLVLMQAAPALMEADLETFGKAITEIQAYVGAHFSPAQGGSAWSNPRVGEICRKLGGAGAVGIGQSSWGPTGFAFVPDEKAAATLYHSFVQDAKAQGLELMIVAARNHGATIETAIAGAAGQ